ncbi:MAG: DUF58 domain-containing protein [Crocinitomicaceae bacterium]|nr:DUF58 domain-containing protein [Crocinitomicaceae bacterium]|tara:strand:+ start:2560 stop:3492 length:933 start_codon:yes stop_codon:yes gene_type:complete
MSSIDQNIVRQFSSLDLFARQVVEGFLTGMHKSPFHGFSVEFAEHRQYNSGESIRHIDWKLYGRTEKLFVKKYEEETNLRCQLVIDSSSSMYFPFNNSSAEEGQRNKLDFSVHAAASLVHLFSRQRDAVGLTSFAEHIDLHLPSLSNLKHRHRVFLELENMLKEERMNRKSNLADTLHHVSEKIHKRSMVIVFSDLFDNSEKSLDDLFAAFQHLRHNKHEVVLFNVMDGQLERELNFEDRPYTFIDPETGEQLKLNPLSLREQYQQKLKEFEHEIDLKCGQNQIDYVEVDIADGFYPVLLSFLAKRNKMQ